MKRWLAILIVLLLFCGQSATAAADSESAIADSVTELTEEIDATELDEIISEMDPADAEIFGGKSFSEKIEEIASGKNTADYATFISYLISLLFGEVRNFFPMILTVLGICAAFSVINSIKGKFASESVSGIIRIAAVASVTVTVFSALFKVICESSDRINGLNDQINAVFPIILTLMSAVGASSSVAAYKPAVAILGNALTQVLTAVALPCFILTVVFEIIGNLSDAVKLKKLSGFFASALKWVLGTGFFVFLAFLSVQGITASVYDGISVRTAKYAISNYVPIIGGYLSEGFNLVLAGSNLIKNAVGLSGILLLFATMLPLLIKIAVLSLSFNLLGALSEPLGLNGVSGLLSGISKSVKTLAALVAGITFLYFVFLLLTVCTGNLAL